MTTWILLVFAHVGPFGNGNSNALTNVPGFTVQAECIAAGEAYKKLAAGTYKEILFTCVKQTGVKP